MTRATDRYRSDAVADALNRISSQGLWLLLSLDHYGWRVEYDAIRVLLAARVEGEETYAEHAPLLAMGQLFALVDKLWRLIYAMRAHRAGREFLNDEDGYLRSGYKLDKRLAELEHITPKEWRDLLGVPSDEVIRQQLSESGATVEEIETRVSFANELPQLIATNMRELQHYFEQEDALAGPRPKMFSLREVDGQHRHGAPVVYQGCSPTDTGWRAVERRDEDLHRGDTVGIVMLPPDDAGAALIALFKHDEEMVTGLRYASGTLAALVLRLTRSYLLALSPGLVDDPLAAVADYDV